MTEEVFKYSQQSGKDPRYFSLAFLYHTLRRGRKCSQAIQQVLNENQQQFHRLHYVRDNTSTHYSEFTITPSCVSVVSLSPRGYKNKSSAVQLHVNKLRETSQRVSRQHTGKLLHLVSQEVRKANCRGV